MMEVDGFLGYGIEKMWKEKKSLNELIKNKRGKR